MLRIVVERNGQVILDRSIGERLVSIGRAYDNDVVLADEQVSSHHLVVKKGGDGVYTAIDQSANGTYYEGQRVSTLRLASPQVLVLAGYEVTLIPEERTDTVEAGLPNDTATTVTDDLPVTTQKIPKANGHPSATLRLERDGGQVDSISFVDSAIVGRDEDCDLRIQSREISRKHAFIFRRGDEYVVKRLSKTNPVRVNSKTLREGESCALGDGDVIDMSGFPVEFLGPEAAFGDRATLVEGRQPNIGFSIETRWETREIVRLDLLGFLGEKTTQRFESAASDAIEEARKVIVDLGYLIGIDEVGLASLVRAAAECERNGIRMVIENVSPRVLDAVRGSSMRKILEPYVVRAGEAGQ